MFEKVDNQLRVSWSLRHGHRGAGSRRRSRGCAFKAFLKRQKQEVPVVSAFKFVGRRRQLQLILPEFNKPDTDRKAGVFIRGPGRRGKIQPRRSRRRAAGRARLQGGRLHGRYDVQRFCRPSGNS